MDKRIAVVGILLVAVLGLIISPYVKLFGEDYGTGLNINTETKKFEIKGHYNVNGKKIFYTDPEWEQLDSDVYITSWMPNENSMKIITTAKFYLAGHSGGVEPFLFPDIFFGQYAWMVEYIDTSNHHHLIIDGRNNWIDTNYVSVVQGEVMGNIPGKNYDTQGGWVSGNVFGDNTWFYIPAAGGWRWEHLQTPSLSFVIKGNKVGAIRVYCLLEYAEMRGNPFLGGRAHAGELLASEDWAYLASGIGKVDVLGTNSVRQEGTTRTIPTNRVVPLYVFEEGSTVVFSVDTGYAGAASGQKGWRLAVYKSDQTQPLAVWWLDDDLRNYHIEWTIPKGTWTPGGDNEMMVVLTNTVIDQAEKTFFVVDNISKIPGKPQIIMDRTQYNEGDTVHVILRAEANPDGTGEVSEFRVQVKWDSPDSTSYILNKRLPAYHIEGLTYGTSFEFTVDRPNRYFYILVWALDREGRANDNMASGYVKQVYGNYKVTFHVVDINGKPVEGAKVEVKGVASRDTDSNGNATFYLERKQYEYTVSKEGYKDFSSTFTASANMVIDVTLQPAWSVVSLLVGSIGAAAGVGGIVYYYKKKKGGVR